MQSIIDRYAPSPTGSLHIGNLRTALAGWLLTRSQNGRWLVRQENLDVARVHAAGELAHRQLDDLVALGLSWDGAVTWQSQRLDAYAQAISSLRGRTYECFCTRKEIAESASAPQGDGYRPYPGTCSQLTPQEVAKRRLERRGALRVRAQGAVFTVLDLNAGEVSAEVDDFVLVRSDGAYSYHLAATVDDVAQGVTRVTRGVDLLSSAPRQAWLAQQLGATPPTYTHIGLVTNPAGDRLAKRDGSVTLKDLAARGLRAPDVVAMLSESLGLGRCGSAEEALKRMPTGELPASDSAFWRGAVWDDAALQLRVEL